MSDYMVGVMILVALIVLCTLPGWLAAVIILGGLVGGFVLSEIKKGGFK